MTEKKRFKVKKGNPFPLGVSRAEEGVQFAKIIEEGHICKLLLFEPGCKRAFYTFTFDKNYQTGNVYSVILADAWLENMEYCYEIDGKREIDSYAKLITGKEQWASKKWLEQKGKIRFQAFDWEGDSSPNIAYENMILYQLHVRGFTKHISSGVKARGTFEGIREKIPYLKDLGVNALFLLPIYEFEERMKEESETYKTPQNIKELENQQRTYKLNYWGYTPSAHYFAPKISYAYDRENTELELKTLIKSLHKNGIEIILDMFFDIETNIALIIDCLRHWILEYHVDGFRINDNVIPTKCIIDDPVIGSVKLLTTSWNADTVRNNKRLTKKRLAAEYNDGFMVDIRKFLKSDEGQVNSFIERMKKNPENFGVINYITNVNGFTLMDLVSYDIKHNEKNGEDGRDGTDYNYSWNCGVEGKTKKKSILALRKKQMFNGLLMLFLSQGTPMLLAGDEFGNTQEGNNNAYCQDNRISWLNWSLAEKNKDIVQFIKNLIVFRKSHPMLHLEKPLRIIDYKSCGFPDLSFHGTKAWYLDASNYSRVLGIMLCGLYAGRDSKSQDNDFYIAYNMHWEAHTFDLPRLPKKKIWEKWIDTGEFGINTIEKNEKNKQEDVTTYLVMPRSIVLFQSKMTPEI